ncbi:hypothetical protein SLEP1_g14904 [Rubroshorea leprosula]|uniref:Uncharacterized protein n=1 Tax=Rubroshorea leprosula TaxID=152421 RepID=A0AAV5IWE5_9ROSI|nr:hypothetical protein SLEP1_g14904 [Rubroshorea leprosula]
MFLRDHETDSAQIVRFEVSPNSLQLNNPLRKRGKERVHFEHG